MTCEATTRFIILVDCQIVATVIDEFVMKYLNVHLATLFLGRQSLYISRQQLLCECGETTELCNTLHMSTRPSGPLGITNDDNDPTWWRQTLPAAGVLSAQG